MIPLPFCFVLAVASLGIALALRSPWLSAFAAIALGMGFAAVLVNGGLQ